jgi:pyridoxal phosphate enzyme (YggS family)
MDLQFNFETIRGRMADACRRVERSLDSVLLLPVSKGQPPEMVRAAADLGLNIFGENRIQEAKAKISMCPGRLRWHMIGHLQTNKCREAVRMFELIHSVDSLHLATELDRHAERAARTLPILLEVNVAGEGSKHGFGSAELLAEFEQLNRLKRLEVHGLMTIAPWTPEPEKVRPVLRRLRELKVECEMILGAPLPHLSMGMSGDLEVAIEEGATIVRVGTALFGDRR